MRRAIANKHRVTIKELPPKLIMGSVRPLVGSKPMLMPILTKTWPASIKAIPAKT
jgi:hypothetical protein